jgi:hypothetical protein
MWKSLKNKHILPFLGLNPHNLTPFYGMVSPWMKNGNIRQYLAEMGTHGLSNSDVNELVSIDSLFIVFSL